MKNRIIRELSDIEKKNNVKILCACESGSRAWGFPSNDSDYDVRFIYVHPQDWYLSIADKRDVIELPIDDQLDINGWDLRKALQLMRKSNSPLLEWLSSPIQYRVNRNAFDSLLVLSRKAFLAKTSCHHYLAMAKKYIDVFQGNEKVKLKTYMYAIRATLCCDWIVRHSVQPPMELSCLLTAIKNGHAFKETVNGLVEEKKANGEGYQMRRSESIERYLFKIIDNLPDRIPDNPKKPEIDLFDAVFRKILVEIDS